MQINSAREKKSLYAYFFIAMVLMFNFTGNSFMNHLEKRGIFTNYWVINDTDEMHKVLDRTYINGIMTDRPLELLKVLKEREEKK
jgi:glycerophosphoryl diester phosphodiesterase